MGELTRHSDVTEPKRQETAEIKSTGEENHPSAEGSRSLLDSIFGRLFGRDDGEASDSRADAKTDKESEAEGKETSSETERKETSAEPDGTSEVKGEQAEERIAVPNEISNTESKYGGGSYKAVERYEKEHGIEGHEKHHTPSNDASDIKFRDGPCISMEKKDHWRTAGFGNSKEAREYRAKQAELIRDGKFREAFEMDVKDIQSKFGDKYDAQIAETRAYIDKLEKAGIV